MTIPDAVHHLLEANGHEALIPYYWERLSRSVPMRVIKQFSDRLEVKSDA